MVLAITDKVNKAVPVRATVRDLTSGNILIIPTPSAIQYDPGETLGEIDGANCNGVKVALARYTTELKPKMTLTFARTARVYGLKRNRLLTAGTTASTTPIFQSDYVVPSNGIKPAATVGFYGYGVVADATAATASYLDDNDVLQPMVQYTPYSTFNPATTPYGFAIGPNMALAFGNSLIGRVVSFQIPNSVSTYQTLSTTTFSQLELRIALITIDNTLELLSATGVTVDTTGAINYGEPNQEVPFFLQGDPVFEQVPQKNYC